MGPIYWDPVHDISSVVRGTWFYKDTMMPVETDVANQIEEGYEYMKPWTQTYIDEVNSCLEIGADAELKLVHRLWPAGDSGEEVRPETQRSNMSLLTKAKDQLNSDERVRRHAIILAAKPENRAAGILEAKAQPDRLYAKSSVIFANSRDAQILRPNLLPSMARGRRPLAAIRKGRAVGVQVTRGFDHKIWEKLHPIGKKAAAALKSQEGQSISRHDQSGPGPERQSPCRACSAEQERPRPTDLVLVIHGYVKPHRFCVSSGFIFKLIRTPIASVKNYLKGSRVFISLTPSTLFAGRSMSSSRPQLSSHVCGKALVASWCFR